MSRSPIRYAWQNLIFDHTGHCGALYRIPTISYALLPDSEKWKWMLAMCGLALRARADITIYRVHRSYPSSDYVEQATDLMDPSRQDPAVWQAFLESHVPLLEGLDGDHVPEVYVRVGMADPTNARHIVRALDRTARRINAAFGVGSDSPIMQRELLELHERQALVLDRIRDAVPNIRPVTTRELQWLCRRAAVRGVDEPFMDPWWQPDAMVLHTEEDGAAFKPLPGDFRRLFKAGITRQDDHLVVVGEGQSGPVTSYQTFLTLGLLPTHGPDFPGMSAELLSGPPDSLPDAVDSVAHLEWVTNQRALTELRRKLNNAEDRIREALKAARTPDERTLLTPSLARDLEQLLMHETKPPMFDGTISYAISEPSLAEMTRTAEAVRDALPGLAVHRPPGDQDALYRLHLPTPTTVVSDWAQRLTLDQVGMLMPIAGREIGDKRGVYFAHTTRGRSHNPVKNNPGGDAKDARPSTTYAVGIQGSGKTVGMLNLAYAAGAMRGAPVYTWDPGGDHFITELERLEGRVRLIMLQAQESERGRLDPLTAAPPEVQEEVALSYYMDLMPDTDSTSERELMSAIKGARQAGTGGRGVIAILKEGNAIAHELARGLELISEFGLGILGFGDGQIREDDGEDALVTTFRMKNLGLPSADADRAGYDRRQRTAVATFKVAVAHIIGVATKDRRAIKWIVLDEAWVFDGPDGRHLLATLVRLARKNNVRLILCSQTVGDLGQLKHLIGNYFIFGLADADQAADALRLIGADPDDPSLVGLLTNKQFRKGLCLFRDSDGRIEVIQHDMDDETLETLNTDPNKVRPQEEVHA